VKRALALAPLFLLAALVVLSVLLLTRGGARETISEGQIGRPAPIYALERLGGGALVTSADMAGRPYLINVFASWCTPCRVEHPVLIALRDNGVEIIGIAYKDAPNASARFLDQLGNPFSSVAMDPEGRFALELGTAGVPETFVISGDGTINAVHRGPLTPEIVETIILPALGAP
jgi:cytochrome c biogenesis protein CcmG/thiol:disulfide interchange protein DsbE